MLELQVKNSKQEASNCKQKSRIPTIPRLFLDFLPAGKNTHTHKSWWEETEKTRTNQGDPKNQRKDRDSLQVRDKIPGLDIFLNYVTSRCPELCTDAAFPKIILCASATKRGKLLYLQLELFCLQLSFSPYSPLRPFKRGTVPLQAKKLKL